MNPTGLDGRVAVPELALEDVPCLKSGVAQIVRMSLEALPSCMLSPTIVTEPRTVMELLISAVALTVRVSEMELPIVTSLLKVVMELLKLAEAPLATVKDPEKVTMDETLKLIVPPRELIMSLPIWNNAEPTIETSSLKTAFA